jgi:hypothetical protein
MQDLDLRGVLGGLLEAKEALQSRLQVATEPDAPDAGRAHGDSFQAELVGDALRAVGRMVEAIGEDPYLDLGADAVRVRPAGAAALLDERLDPTDLEGAADFVEGVAMAPSRRCRALGRAGAARASVGYSGTRRPFGSLLGERLSQQLPLYPEGWMVAFSVSQHLKTTCRVMSQRSHQVIPVTFNARCCRIHVAGGSPGGRSGRPSHSTSACRARRTSRLTARASSDGYSGAFGKTIHSTTYTRVPGKAADRMDTST